MKRPFTRFRRAGEAESAGVKSLKPARGYEELAILLFKDVFRRNPPETEACPSVADGEKVGPARGRPRRGTTRKAHGR
jgi:hypothetical protein